MFSLMSMKIYLFKTVKTRNSVQFLTEIKKKRFFESDINIIRSKDWSFTTLKSGIST